MVSPVIAAVIAVVAGVVAAAIAFFAGVSYRRKTAEAKIGSAEEEAKRLINDAMKAASNESFGYTEEELVSSDIIGIKYGSLFDATQTMVSEIGEGAPPRPKGRGHGPQNGRSGAERN